MPPILPQLLCAPRQHIDCCASLSSTLLDNIITNLPYQKAIIASIGCGSGLLEAFLLARRPILRLLGIEVASCPVKYLSLENTRIVNGTREICPETVCADMWMFVYPRTTALVRAYLEAAEACIYIKLGRKQ